MFVTLLIAILKDKLSELSPNFYTWCALVGSFTDGVVNPDPAAVELLVSHGAACFLCVLGKQKFDK